MAVEPVGLVIDEPPVWHLLTSKSEARALQSFTCTVGRPRTEGGRQLAHPRPWEWEVQAHLRDLRRRMKAGELLIFGRDDNDVIVAAAHLIVRVATDHVEVMVAAGAVHVEARGRGGGIADALMAECRRIATQLAATKDRTVVLLTGRIHAANLPSQRMAVRAGLEPVGAPGSTYQDWVLVLPSEMDG